MPSFEKAYLVAGIFNTIFGYVLSLLIYHYFQYHLSIITIGIIINITSISVAFVSYKLFVFKTVGNWFYEYFRCCVTYGVSAFVGIGLLWFFVGYLSWTFWVSQGIIMISMVAISYFMHQKYTFRMQR